jgi:hypothetical protein
MRDMSFPILRDLIAGTYTSRYLRDHFKRHAVSALMEHAGEHITLCDGMRDVDGSSDARLSGAGWLIADRQNGLEYVTGWEGSL